MVRNNSELYFDELYSIVWDRDYPSEDYSLLLRYLFDTEFVYFMEMDENRAAHGLELRHELGFHSNRPCNVLEMMVALSQRMEDIMYEINSGDRTPIWFWTMLESMGLDDMSDDNYDEAYVEDTVQRMLYREYAYNGRGGLFTVEHPEKDMRNVDIWYQMHCYINEISKY